ncbi:MAG: phage shock protein C [Moritella sp.]|jgi:phage shock protein C
MEAKMINRKLYRDPKNGIFGGVCAGLAEYFGIETWMVRILVVSAFLLSAGFFVILAYIAACLILEKIPEDRKQQQSVYKAHNVKQKSWQAGRSAAQILQSVDTELTEMECNIRHMEAYVTSSAFKVEREINDL